MQGESRAAVMRKALRSNIRLNAKNFIKEIDSLLPRKGIATPTPVENDSEYIEMSDDQEPKVLAEESTQEKNPQKLLEIIFSLAAAIHEQDSHRQTAASATPTA
jgi:predicted ribonuclease YlaK